MLWATIAYGMPSSLMPSWGQASGGILNEQGIADLVAHLLTWSSSTASASSTSLTTVAPLTPRGPLFNEWALGIGAGVLLLFSVGIVLLRWRR